MITKLLVIDADACSELVETLNHLVASDVKVITFDLCGGFIEPDTTKNLFVENILQNVRTLSETQSVNLTNIGFLYSEQASNSRTSSGYTNSYHIIENIENNPDNMKSWDYMVSTMEQLYLVTMVESVDFIDINHFLYSQHYSYIFDYMNSNIKKEIKVNYLKNNFKLDVISDELTYTNNWLYSICTRFNSDDIKVLVDRYFHPTNVSLENVKNIELKLQINIRYLFNETIDDTTTIINNIILYDLHLQEYLEDVQNTLLSNTAIITFSKMNSFIEIKQALDVLYNDENSDIKNIALFQNNTQQSLYNIVSEETSTIKNVITKDPSLNTWSQFTDFVVYLEQQLSVQNFDLLMCKIYSDDNWKYVIDNVSSQLSSLEIRSSEDVTGHVLFEGDWILESPAEDVNLVGLYFNESIKNVDVHLNGGYVFTTRSDLQQAVNDWIAGDTTTYGHISTWDTANVTNMSSLFSSKSTFNEDISTWNTSNVTNMDAMFQSATNFSGDLSNWNVSKVTSMYQMFMFNTSFNSDLSNWNVSNVKDFGFMFYSTYADLSFSFSNWNVSNALYMNLMFRNTKFNQDISNWDVANVDAFDSMFRNASNFNQDLNSWQVKSDANLSSMFQDASSFNQVLTGYYWLNHAGTQTNMFQGSSGSFGTLPDPLTITIVSTDLSNNDNSDYGVVNMVVTSSSSMTITETDISLTNGVISEFTKNSGTNYSFKVSSNSLTGSTSLSILENSVYNDSVAGPYNQASNTFEWTWNYTIVPPVITISSKDIDNGDTFPHTSVNMTMEIRNDLLHGNKVESSILPSDVSAENGYIFGVGRNNSTQDYLVTVSDKTNSHPHYNSGSSSAYYIEESSSTDISYIGGTGESYVDIPFSVDNVVYFEKPLASGDAGVYEEISGTITDGVQGYYAKGNVLFPDYSSAGFSAGTNLSQDILLFNENDWTVEFFMYPTQNSNGYFTSLVNFGDKSTTAGSTKGVFEINYYWNSY